jgi:hypothetical protein
MDRNATARTTGVLYLLLAIAGGVGFLVVRPRLYVPHDATATAANVVAQASLARVGITLELAVVVFQALCAIGFLKLFREIDPVAAAATAAFGLVNATALLGSAACLWTALAVVGDPAFAPGGDVPRTTQLLYELSGAAWRMGNVFFGLWLIPMGYAARRSGGARGVMGLILIVGGVGYVASAVAGVWAAPTAIVDGLVIPATIGELWMIGYLLFAGWR